MALDEVFVEGLVHVSELGQDYFHFDPAKHWLLGERTGQRFRLGDRVRVKVVRADIETSKIDFGLVTELSRCRKKPPRRRRRPAEAAEAEMSEKPADEHAAEKLIYGFHAVMARLRQDPVGHF